MNAIAKRHFKKAAINLDMRWWEESFALELSNEPCNFMDWSEVLHNYETLGEVEAYDYYD